MPVLGKHTLTRYLGSDCQKQLRILLAPERGKPSERELAGMPPKQPPLPGLNAIAQAGDEWAASRLAELDRVLGSTVLVGNRRTNGAQGVEFDGTTLAGGLAGAQPDTFLAEHQYPVPVTFVAEFGAAPLVDTYGLTFEEMRPDLIQVRGAGTAHREVLPDGSVQDLALSDPRMSLRVIDIKLTSEPGPGYFAEVVYYSVALAGWLKDNGLDGSFSVSADPAIWPGNHQASALMQAESAARAQSATLTTGEALASLDEDLEPAPLPVFVSRLQHFFRTTLPGVLAKDWDKLPFHVSTRCRGCDFLGQKWTPDTEVDPRHCLPTAQATDHLSKIAFVSRGAGQLLTKRGIYTVATVARTPPEDAAYDTHHSLRGQRTVINARAATLSQESGGGLAPMSGTSAVLPSWSDLNIYVTADFDSSSAITFAFGAVGFWSEPGNFDNRKVWNSPKTFAVQTKDLKREEQVLLQFLNHLDSMLEHVRRSDIARNATARTASSVQVFVWDDLTYRHLCRVVGRHLEAILAARNGVRLLAWLFPPEEILANSKLLTEPVISIVSDSVRALLALPIPHHYSLLETARHYHSASMQAPFNEFRMPFLWEDPLSDQIPSERAHDLWKQGPDYTSTVKSLDWSVSTRLQALEEVTKRLRADLRGQLQRRAPKIGALAPPPNTARLTADEQLIMAYTRLNAAMSGQDAARVRAMPPHEREARFASARLRTVLQGAERAAALTAVGLGAGSPSMLVYEVRPSSGQANFKEGEYLCALVPESRVEILDWNVRHLVSVHGGDPDAYGGDAYASVADVFKGDLIKFDRDLNLVVFEPDSYRSLARQRLIDDGIVSLEANVSLEKITKDFFSEKLQATLQAIGRTPKAVNSPIAVRAIGGTPRPNRNPQVVPVEDVLWDAPTMAATPVQRNVAAARAALVNADRDLNASQWQAFEHALTYRLSLLWGPPGTGKSRTVANIVTGAVLDATTRGVPLRVLISSATYSAVDNVLDQVAPLVTALAPEAEVWRGRGNGRDPAVAPVRDVLVGKQAGPVQQGLQNRLLATSSTSVTIVGANPHQVHKLAFAAGGAAAPLFDLIVIDEASQIDVANALLPLATLAADGCVIVAGDPLQLPPIHQVDPPLGTEYLVGSIYDFLSKTHQVVSQNLMVNYRSNDEIVALARDAEYPSGLQAHSPNLRLNMLSPLPSGAIAPSGWPAALPWSEDLTALLEPNEPVTCVVYTDGLSGQSNEFEAQTVAALIWLLHDRLADRLDGELAPDGTPQPRSNTAHAVDGLLTTGVGVVTPHRAQQSMITALVSRTLPGATPDRVRSAVDTVERFQGQQRDVIIASYAVGDPDTIATEDEFLQSLNRFNVMASRARAKLVVLVSDELVQHLPNDIKVLRASSLLKSFAETRCSNRSLITLAVTDAGETSPVVASLRTS